MQFDNQKTRNVADAVAKILAGESAKQEPKMLEEELKGQQHKIDVNKNNKIDAHDFKLLRAKKEVKKEEVEQEEEKSMTFSEMIAAYKEHGLAVIAEEPTEEQFNKEIQDQIASATGKKKQPGVSTPSTQGVKSMPEEVEVIDVNQINGVEEVTIDERTLTKPEAKKKEEIVKSMKKGMKGFKERYGERAKEVMYATATKQAMKEETESEHYKAGHEYASDHAQDSGFKVTARARKKEMLADNPHKKGTTEHSDWHRGALAGHQTALDNM